MKNTEPPNEFEHISPIATYEVQMSTQTGQASVAETFVAEVSSERAQWIRTFAGVITSIRFGAFVEPDAARQTVIAISHRISTTDREWQLVDELMSDPDMEFRVAIAKTGPDGIEDAEIHILVPTGEDVMFALDAAIVLREWLCELPGGPIPGVPRFGYNVVADVAMREMIDAADSDTQAFAPFKCMEVIEREGYLHPHITRFPIEGLEEFGDDRWEEIQLGPER